MRYTPRGPAHRTARRLLAGAVALAVLALAGCSSQGPGGPGGSSTVTRAQLRSGSLGERFDLSGEHFTVGSKEFTEQQILGRITLYALRAAGARTSDQTGLSGSAIVRHALQSGDVDMYWEYAGTGWTQYLGHDRPVPGERAQFRATARADARRHGIRWLGPARFADAYAIARSADAPGAVGAVDRLSQLRGLAAAHPDDLSLCGAAEFLDRELAPFQRAYDLHIPSPQVYQNAFALNFVNVAKGSPCRFAEVFTTDSRLKTLHLKVLDDDRHHFTSEPAGLTVREQTLRAHPELGGLARMLGDELTEDTMIELCGLVDQKGETADQAALYFLRSRGLIGG